MTRYALNPVMPVLLRPNGAVQVGWDPRRAVLGRLNAGVLVVGGRSVDVSDGRCAVLLPT